MEHVVSGRVHERLAAHLGQPLFDRTAIHPQPDGSIPTAPHTPLAQLRDGERFVVHRVPSQDSEVLAYREHGVEPGASRLRGREPGGNLLLLDRTVPGSAAARQGRCGGSRYRYRWLAWCSASTRSALELGHRYSPAPRPRAREALTRPQAAIY